MRNTQTNKVRIIFTWIILVSGAGCAFSQSPKELVIIDDALENRDLIIENVKETYEVWLLKNSSDPVKSISEKISEYSGLEALHLFVRGKAGLLLFGDKAIDNTNLSAYSSLISGWKEAFGENADLLIYSCDFAGSEEGRLMIRRISAYTGLDVAASTNKTGNLGEEADWALEFMKGKIDTGLCLDENRMNGFHGKILEIK